MAGRARMGHSSDIKTLLDDFAGFKPTFILAVPRVFEKIYNSSEAKAEADGRGKIFLRAATVATAWSQALDDGGPGSACACSTRCSTSSSTASCGRRWAVRCGMPCRAAARSAPASVTSTAGSGWSILEGYGLTETTAPATVNTPDKVKIGTVGPPLPGTSIRIADDGEILIQGVGVFACYHDNDAATRECIVDGWFHTGDLGSLDEDGYLKITGRKKEILVTAGGKNVAPAVLEDRLRAHPLVSQCIVVGDLKPFIAALVTIDEEMWPSWASNHGLEGVSFEQAGSNPKVLEAIQHAVDRANEAVSKAESIRRFAVLAR